DYYCGAWDRSLSVRLF
nr:immunoglobulin light chain junction region [Macaca mulatta]MOY16125.1 immunoglobulin light chain junction region [Macaca mulatta]MOY16160.1 immunoglobulin light chain junction region [Macaca mulatta]MOY16274.1 immunoglobulin light chain junction region [Macaca mulatta]MOY16648.1 immunoglobulin light chain junction region [Macaca mulatta]